MSYTPTVWADGDIITAERMNKIENALDGVPYPLFVVNVQQQGYTYCTLDASCNQIKSAIDEHKIVIIKNNVESGIYYSLLTNFSTSLEYNMYYVSISVLPTNYEIIGFEGPINSLDSFPTLSYKYKQSSTYTETSVFT